MGVPRARAPARGWGVGPAGSEPRARLRLNLARDPPTHNHDGWRSPLNPCSHAGLGLVLYLIGTSREPL